MAAHRPLRIGDLAKRTGVSVKALRLYDGLGLLVSARRSEANYRLFGEEAVACVRCIRTLQAAGLTLRDLHDLAAACRSGTDIDELVPHKLSQVRARLDERAAQLEATRARLRTLLAHADRVCRTRSA